MKKLNRERSDGEFEELLLRVCSYYPVPSQARIDSVWEKILVSVKKAKRTFRRYVKYAAAAACAAIVVLAVSPVGRAAADSLYEHIFPDKDNVIISMEGSDEKVNYSGEVVEYPDNSGLADYGVYIDRSIYKVKKDKDTLIITPLDYTDEDMKENPVYMTIVQTASDVSSSLTSELDKIKAKNPVSVDVEKSDLIGSSDKIYARWFETDDYEWDADVESVYVAGNGKGGSFIVTLHYFAECEEGHAVRMTEMANSITVFKD